MTTTYAIKTLDGSYIRESMRSATSADVEEVLTSAATYLGLDGWELSRDDDSTVSVDVDGKSVILASRVES
jgi:hypothetical protein